MTTLPSVEEDLALRKLKMSYVVSVFDIPRRSQDDSSDNRPSQDGQTPSQGQSPTILRMVTQHPHDKIKIQSKRKVIAYRCHMGYPAFLHTHSSCCQKLQQ